VRVARSGGVHHVDRRGRNERQASGGGEQAPVTPQPDQDPAVGGAGPAQQLKRGRLRVVSPGKQRGLPPVTAPPVAAGEHRVQRRGRNVGHQRPGVGEHENAGRKPGCPPPQPAIGRAGQRPGGAGPRRRDQAVPGHVDRFARRHADRVPPAGVRLRAQAGDERPLAIRLHQHHVETGVQARVGWPEHLDAFGRERGPDQVTPRASAVTAGVGDRHALPGRGRHHVEAAADVDRRPGGDQVATAGRQSRDAHDQIDDRLTGQKKAIQGKYHG
jgi:hypothetical protein